MQAGLRRDILVVFMMLGILIALPFVFTKPALRDFLVYVMAYGLLAMSLNLLVGLTGLVSFGHAAFFASGAYLFGLLMQSGRFSIPLAMLVTVLGTAVLSLVIGAICVRLKELYFSFITLAFQMFIHSVILTWVSLTGGDQGLRGGIPRPPFLGIDLEDSTSLYLFCVVVFVVCVAVMRQIWQSPFGYTLRLIRDNPNRAVFLGVNVVRMKLGIFVLAGAMASMGGVLLALFVSGAYPDFAFWTTSGEAIFMIMLGGTQLFFGPIVGAVLLRLLEHFATIYTGHSGLVLGIVILIIVLGLRQGIGDYVVDWLRRRKDGRPELSGKPDATPAETSTETRAG
ncbi:branched-chain amino acid ABC transporter permease [Actimicrobium sp. CCI2.3]|uniref:branched-chain amino acid ABC transporter permease n=1 Tax=Actimicrobium sp. CCI2.3 TaxID=3048616 RepID=UPI002AB5A1A4|nr:branched-chain amino acid ABC transporter permease [Actimicrobium sp. CCI2.3]MDY7573070.1 branched-chain amino acid ABC transporter permease [Actimicrobium sp. CCI2.3]MEB0020867.1 branched-chain amino acid ABC transporter permease [Actimicrobium sp. CCI2.3]